LKLRYLPYLQDGYPEGVIGIFSLTYSFRSHYGPGVDTTSNRNECQGYLRRVKAAGV